MSSRDVCPAKCPTSSPLCPTRSATQRSPAHRAAGRFPARQMARADNAIHIRDVASAFCSEPHRSVATRKCVGTAWSGTYKLVELVSDPTHRARKCVGDDVVWHLQTCGTCV